MRKSPIRPGDPLPRRARLKRKGGSRYPKRRDAKFMAWMLHQLKAGRVCDGCGSKWARQRAHVQAKGSGGDDRGNVVLLCVSCHGDQEKRTAAFCREKGVDLYAKAERWAARYEAQAA